jgi:rhomboid protease GluP
LLKFPIETYICICYQYDRREIHKKPKPHLTTKPWKMTREEQLNFCENCDHKGFNMNKGIVCSLTGEKADFEDDCPDFRGNRANLTTAKIKAHFASIEKRRWQFLQLLIPGKQLLITPLIFYACLLIFLAMSVSGVHILKPDPDSLINWGGNFKPHTLERGYWRLLTCIFIHAGIFHLISNMVVLFIIGYLLEPLIEWRRFIIVYLVSGLGGSIVSLLWNNLTVAIGASGAIFGLYGVFIALILSKVVKNQHKDILASLIIFLVYNLINSLKPGIDMAAHVGGLATGLLSGFALFPLMSKKYDARTNNIIFFGSLSTVLFTILFILFLLPGSLREFYRIMDKFHETEQKAMSLYNLPPDTSKEKVIQVINEEGLPNWEKCFNILDETGNLKKLPRDLNDHIELLRKYCQYRIESYKLIALSLENRLQKI